MGVQTGSYAKARLTLDVELTWQCSNCQKENQVVQTLTANATEAGPAYAKEKTQSEMRERAANNARLLLEHQLRDLNSSDPVRRYRTASFTCTCVHCGHREPWARMDYSKLPVIRSVLKMIALWGGGLLAFFFLSGIDGRNEQTLAVVFAAALVLPLLLLLILNTLQKRHTDKMESLIARLPPESHPEIKILPRRQGQS